MTWQDSLINFALTYGFQILGAVIIFSAGLLVARWIGRLTERWLMRHEMEPPVRNLMVRLVWLIVMAFTLVAVLQNVGVPVLSLIAGLSVIGVGVGLAMQGVLSNLVAGLTIIFTKPFLVGEYVQLI